MNIGNLDSKHSVGVEFKENSGLKMTGIFVIFLSQHGFESDLQKESPKQSLPKVTSEADVRRCSSK